MEILRVFNNNVVLAKDGHREVIATGRGLGFQAKPGMHVDDAKVVRVFVPADGRDPDHVGELLSEIPPEVIRLVTDAMAKVGLADQIESQPTLVMALADHVTGALRRAHDGVVVEYPLQAEVQSLYSTEYAQAVALASELNRHLDCKLPPSETVALALHLVNAGFATGDLSDTYKMTGVIQQMLAVIEQTYGVKLDQHSINVGRFITHLRYLFVRIHQGKQLDKEPEPIIESIRQSYPKAMSCADIIGSIVALRLDTNLTEDEVAYLALHVSRVVADADASKQ
ncbi:transcription antiterminator BglG [Bifidobacterium goeldii]|uniref:Transcription antiterminator BglG n=1 Tax=Bifidobacterium goeldii TaxID=2306975 RepID=A0A430FJ63_9BIFI|nr:PRD domain-containing protein [Bifidobacterium goeldii]RSX52822.1 transcription antiterminator BglG [Bifidobacterium goeldii]